VSLSHAGAACRRAAGLLAFPLVRVLLDYRPALRSRTGVGEYVHELLWTLARTRRPGEELMLFSSSWADRLAPETAQAFPGVRLIDRRVPVRVLNWLWHRAQWPPVEWLAGGAADLVHAAHPIAIPTGGASVITIHDLDFLDHPEWTTAEVQRDYGDLVKRHAQTADGILTSSDHTARAIAARLGVIDTVVVARPGVPRWIGGGRSRPMPADGHLLFVGTLEPRKNVAGLLDAYETLLGRYRAMPDLILMGRPTEAAAPWLERIARPPLAGHVRHLGYVPDAERRSVYEGALLLVLPSWAEGFGLPALEAMALGIPVVASNAGALPEVVGDAGLLVAPEDSAALAAAIEQVVADAGLRSRLSCAGRDRVQGWSWDGTAARVRMLYAQAVTRHAERHAHRG
jgi:glycosyltransferase involved in cell wall biosynthesis